MIHAHETGPTGPDRPAAIARDALRAYGVGPATTLTLLEVSENATFAVDDPEVGERSVLRVYRPGYQTRAAIESELAWIEALRADRVVHTPAVLPAADGSPVVVGRHPDGERRHVARFAWVDGTPPAGARLVEDFRTLGAIAARLHAHVRSWTPPKGFTRFRWDYRTTIGAGGRWGRWRNGIAVGAAEREVLGRLADVLRRRLASYGAGPDRFGLVHADMRLANLLVERSGSPSAGRAPGDVHVIDFDDCGFGWFMYDLGAALSFIEDDPRVPELTAAWVSGYRRVAPLSAAEEAELPTFVLLRRLLLVAWIGSHEDTDLARSMGAPFTRRSCDLAEEFLSRRSRH
jgi:Ser/Thr protein kinase RdoA (MazF antagonist)